ncbi:MAG: hypothetical protein IKS48_01425 [Eubacterium sp.]|nr:hypothetical protein [Eubacterium sp.]
MLKDNSLLENCLLLLASKYEKNEDIFRAFTIKNHLIPLLKMDNSWDVSDFVIGDTSHDIWDIYNPDTSHIFLVSLCNDNNIELGYIDNTNISSIYNVFTDKNWNIKYCIEHYHL